MSNQQPIREYILNFILGFVAHVDYFNPQMYKLNDRLAVDAIPQIKDDLFYIDAVVANNDYTCFV